MSTPAPNPPSPSILRWTLGFLLVGMAWGLTTPFIRRAALDFHPPTHRSLQELRAAEPRSNPAASSSSSSSQRISIRWALWWTKVKILAGIWTIADLLRSPTYALPLLVNLTGSVWFFLLIGRAELSLTVPITNSLAFLFTVLGEWWAEGKVIGRDTWVGMAFVLGGIALCVQSKSSAG